MNHSEDFGFWNMAYSMGWVKKAEVKFVVDNGVLTKVEYKEITGEDY